MQISTVNEHGSLQDYIEHIVAQLGRSSACVRIALCADGRYRQGVSLSYSYGGYGGPVDIESESYNTYAEAMDGGLRELLKRWHMPFATEPASIHEELRLLRGQVLARLQQPNLF